MQMITPSYAPVALSPTMPQLEGPWAIARGKEPPLRSPWPVLLAFASAIASGYHGARRNGGSIFWGVTWFALGALFPVLTPVIGVAQGYGECRYNCRIAPTMMAGSGARPRK